MPLIDLPDGNQLDIPDDATPEMLSAVRQKLKASGQFTSSMKVPEPAGALESAGRDFLQGFGSAATLPFRGASYLAKTFLPEGNGLGQGLTDMADSADQYWKGVGAKSTNSELGQATMRGVGGSATLAPTGAGVAAGAGSGVGEWTANKLSGGNPNPLLSATAQIAGGVLGGTGYAALTRPRPQSANVAREAMEGLTEADLQAAQSYKNELAAQGKDIDLAQALTATKGHSNNLSSIRDYLAGKQQGNAVQGTLRGQPEQLSREAEMTVGSLPGHTWGSTEAANFTQETATARLKQAMGERSAAVKDMYANAGDLPPQSRNTLGAILNKYATQEGATDVMKARAKEMADKLLGRDPRLQTAVDTAREQVANAGSASERLAAQQQLAAANSALANASSKPLRALDVDTWIGELRGPWQGQPLKVAYPKEQGQIKGLAGELNAAFQQMSPKVQAAAGEYSRLSRELVDPLKQGPIGNLSQPHGYDPATQAMVSRFDGIMNKGSNPEAATSNVATAAKELAKVDPEAFQNAFKSWLSSKIQNLTTSSGNGAPLSEIDPKQLKDAFWSSGKGLQWQGIKDATAEMARIRGEKPEDMVRGLENLRQMTIAMADRPSAIGGLAAPDLKELGGKSLAASIVRTGTVIGRFGRAGEGLERMTFGKTLSKFDEILTSPEGAKMLVELSKVPVMSRKAQIILGTFGGDFGNSDGLISNNPPE